MRGSLIAAVGQEILVYRLPEGDLRVKPAHLGALLETLEEEVFSGRGVVLVGPETEELLEEARILAKGGSLLGLRVMALAPPGPVAKGPGAMEVLEDLLFLREFEAAGAAAEA